MSCSHVCAKYKVVLEISVSFYLGLLGMLAYGIFLCTDSSSVGWVCQGSSCNSDDSSSASTATNSWGPCGQGYTGSQESAVTSYASFSAAPTPRPTRLPTQLPTGPTRLPTMRPSSRAPTISRSPTVSADSTCQYYCGSLDGVVCAMRDYSCSSNQYISNYYCGDAVRQCTDPTALGLIISSAVVLGLMTLGGLGSLCLYYVHWNHQRQFQRSFVQTFQTNPVAFNNWNYHGNTSSTPRSIDPEADPHAVASDVPPSKKAEVFTNNLPVVELISNVSSK